jgi:hypothetical protein
MSAPEAVRIAYVVDINRLFPLAQDVLNTQSTSLGPSRYYSCLSRLGGGGGGRISAGQVLAGVYCEEPEQTYK